MYKPMKLADLKDAVDKAVKYAKKTDPDVEFWLDDEMLQMDRISQFEIVPTMVITLKVPE